MRVSNQLFSLRPLHPGFVHAKPIEGAPDETFHALEAEGRLIIERKRNGNAAYASVTNDRGSHVGLYSRGIEDWTAKFPSIIEELREIDLPPDTLVAGEILRQVDGNDSPGALGSCAQSRPERAIALQQIGTPVQLSLFNVIVHRGVSVMKLPYQDRLDILRESLARHTPRNIDIVEVLDMPFQKAKERSIENGWEGLVLYDRNAGSAFRIDGKKDQVPRPLGSWKWKDYLEGDFVATGWIPSTASSHAGCVKDLLIAQYDPLTKQLFSWGKCGVGLTRKQRTEFMNNSLYPMVFELKFERRTANRRLISARIMRQRFDKNPEECIAPIEFSMATLDL